MLALGNEPGMKHPGQNATPGKGTLAQKALRGTGVSRSPSCTGTPPGTRTQNLRIKSPLLCQLS